MKIYVENSFPKYINTDNLHKTTSTTNYIYSAGGIFIIRQNEVVKLIPSDSAIEKYSFGKHNYMIDNSSHIFRKDIYEIPFNHKIKAIEKVQYKHNPNSKVSMITEKEQGKISDIYFETRENKLYTELKEDINTYVSLFNHIKQY